MTQDAIAYIPKVISLEEFLNKHPMSMPRLARLLGVDENTTKSWSCRRRKPTPVVFAYLAVIDEKLSANPALRQQFVK